MMPSIEQNSLNHREPISFITLLGRKTILFLFFSSLDERMSSNESTAPYDELEAFDSIWQALRWTQIRKRLPVCFKKTLHNRYMLANVIYVVYAICLLVIDFHPTFSASSSSSNVSESEFISPLDQPVVMNQAANHFYIGTYSIVSVKPINGCSPLDEF